MPSDPAHVPNTAINKRTDAPLFLHAYGNQLAEMFAYRYGVEPAGNVYHDPHSEFTGKNILYLRHTLAETAAHFELTQEQIQSQLQSAGAILLATRSKRIRPHLDDKILTSHSQAAGSRATSTSQALRRLKSKV